jgi:hypothetical protein
MHPSERFSRTLLRIGCFNYMYRTAWHVSQLVYFPRHSCGICAWENTYLICSFRFFFIPTLSNLAHHVQTPNDYTRERCNQPYKVHTLNEKEKCGCGRGIVTNYTHIFPQHSSLSLISPLNSAPCTPFLHPSHTPPYTPAPPSDSSSPPYP